MAALTGATIAASYLGLLKTSDSGARGAEGSADQCSDGAGNTIPLYVSATEVYAVGSGSGTSHTAFGKDCGVDLSTGTGNALFGEGAGADISTGEHNVAVGYHALFQGTTETNDCVAIGYNSMSGAWTTASVIDCVVIGSGAGAGALVAAASGLTAVGTSAGAAVTSADRCTYIGYKAGAANATGGNNTIVGYDTFDSSYGASEHNTFVGANTGNGAWETAVSDQNTAVGSGIMQGVMNGATANIAMGYVAMAALTTGDRNIAIGARSMDALTQGDDNVAIGDNAMSTASTTDGIDKNVAIGTNALDGTAAQVIHSTVAIGYGALGGPAEDEVSGTVAIGRDTLEALTTGAGNLAIGYQSGAAITSGLGNTAMGYQALNQHVDGHRNMAIGYQAMYQNGGSSAANSNHNIAIGYQALGGDWADATSEHNLALGNGAIAGVLNDANYNIGIGTDALTALTTGDNNTAVGYQALTANTTGSNNTAVGHLAADALVEGAQANTAIGSYALGAGNNDATHDNTCVGYAAGSAIEAGYKNTMIGYNTQASATGGFNQACIGEGTTGVANNSVTLGNASVTAVYMSQDADAQVNCGTVNIDVAQSTGAIIIDNDTAGKGGIHFKDGGASKGLVGLTGVITGDSSEDIGLFSESGAGVSFMVNGGGTRVVYIDSNGAMVKTSQPAFLVQPALDQDNITNSVSTTIVFGTEIFDQGADFASNTFTAPVTGRYQLQFQLQCQELDNAATYFKVELETSNRNITVYENIEDSDIVVRTIGTAILADMDANDTVSLVLYQVGGNNQMDIKSGASFFSGYLVC